ncbi:hypothetical protein F0L17_01375 [Streptomyces sp. TRM43335]|uniref:Uncharacterized protein n=1 Tax=Streptomyces taklimakanensis TaxID=2569853 RepID=A0A6G2B6A6_9ACTN|nr:hypothetical protein [Streptomyces taklimakanensis]MTE17805.1 hypothetical protein [Streptomyces taklimakanensis]
MSSVVISRPRDASTSSASRPAVEETAGPPAEATSRVSVVPRGFTTTAASTVRSMIMARASASLPAVRAFTGSPSGESSSSTTRSAVPPGATTATGISCGAGEWKAPM